MSRAIGPPTDALDPVIAGAVEKVTSAPEEFGANPPQAIAAGSLMVFITVCPTLLCL